MLGDLLEKNERYAAQHRGGELPPRPARRLVILTCMDHRIDPAAALGLELGDAMVLRNPGGRVTWDLIESLHALDLVARNRGYSLADLELILMQHTDCGANALTSTQPEAGVRADIEALTAAPSIPDALSVIGLVYDTETGRVELVERRSPLRAQA
jgi:carbonic anhydrase